MRTVLVNYADRKFLRSQVRNAWTGLTAGGCDLCWSYGRGDLDRAFVRENAEILDAVRGAGYWLWKPYVILDALDKAEDGDAIVYSDSGSFFIGKIARIVQICRDETPGVLGFALGKHPEMHWTKRDAFILMDCDQPKIHESPQIEASLIVLLRNDFARSFITEWLRYARDPRILTDLPNHCGRDNLPGFTDHCHDQSIFSLLNKKNDQWGAPYGLAHGRAVLNARVDVKSTVDWLRPTPRPWWVARWLRSISLDRWRRPAHEWSEGASGARRVS